MVKSKQYGYWNRCWFHEYIFAYLVLPRFDTVYQPHQNLCIDEGMVPWRGNLHFRVYSPDKPDKYGFNLIYLIYFVMRKMGIVWKWSCIQGNLQYPPVTKVRLTTWLCHFYGTTTLVVTFCIVTTIIQVRNYLWIFGVSEWVPLAQFVLIDVGYPKRLKRSPN